MNLLFDIIIIMIFTYYIYQLGKIEKGKLKLFVLFLINCIISTIFYFFKVTYITCILSTIVIILYDLFYDEIPVKLNTIKIVLFGTIYCTMTILNTYYNKISYPIIIEVIIMYILLSTIKFRKLSKPTNIISLILIYLILIFITFNFNNKLIKYLMLIISFLTYLSIESVYKNIEAGFEKSSKYFQEKLLHNQYEEIKNIYLNMRGFRHDYHTHIQSIKAYISMNQITEVTKYLNELETELDRVDSYVKSGNLMIDAILNSKITLADSKRIRINCKANVPKSILISDIDLCIILGNLLDNAIESCEKIDENKRFLRIYISIMKKQLYISIQNSAKEELNFNEKNYISSKRGNHGLGMKRVKILIDKYDGYLNLQNEPGIFASEVSIPL